MKFCPNCGAKLSSETIKFCPECGFKLAPEAVAPKAVTEVPATAQPKNEKAFELLKKELSIRASDLSKNIADTLLEKWKASGKYPQKLGKIVDVIAEKALPTIVQAAVSGATWQNGELTETSGGQLGTTVSTLFPLKLETGIPLIGKISIERVRLTMKGTVDIVSGTVNQVQVGDLDLD